VKKNLLIPGIAILTSTTLLYSCYPGPIYDPYVVSESRQKENLYYVPSSPNTQLLSEKNNIGFNLMASGGSKFSAVETQASFLPARHVGLIAEYSSGKNEGGETYMKYHKFEGGVGYVTPLSKEWHFEAYGGVGTGKINNMHETGSSKISLTNFFIQPAFAVSNKKRTVQFGIVSKFSGVNFKADTAFDNAREPYNTSQVISLYDQPFHLMWEPGLVFRVGWKNFLFHTSYCFSTDLTNSQLHRATDNFSIGGSLRFNASKKDKTISQ
jgi:hypothetical protein